MKCTLSAIVVAALALTGNALPAAEAEVQVAKRGCGYATTPLLRAWNSNFGDHFYTTDEQEYTNALANDGYVGEGVAAEVVPYQTGEVIPFYRLYSHISQDHFYTTSASERDFAISQDSYTDEGIAAYVFGSNDCGTVPFYRMFNPTTGDHFYTTDASERGRAISLDGYNDEGVAAYVNPQ